MVCCWLFVPAELLCCELLLLSRGSPTFFPLLCDDSLEWELAEDVAWFPLPLPVAVAVAAAVTVAVAAATGCG